MADDNLLRVTGIRVDGLFDRYSHNVAAYAKVSQSLDQSFPERLLKSNQWGGLSPETLKNKMQELEIKRQNLREIGVRSCLLPQA